MVQSGDTLSGLAARYLGSVARFGEIYELNRDQLAGPHALKIGMKLRLPTAEPRLASAGLTDAVPSPPAEAPRSVAAETPPSAVSPVDNPAADESGDKLFVPARATPFMPARYRPSSK